MNSDFITQLEPPVLLVLLQKIDPLLIIKNEPPESIISMDDIPDSSHEIIQDIKNIDIVSRILGEDSIKSETIPENILESKHLESVEAQDLVNTENVPFVKIETIIENVNLNRTENTSESNGQEVVEVQDNKGTDKQHVINFPNDLNGISTRSRKPEHPKKTDFTECLRTCETTSWEDVKKKIKVIKAPVILAKPHEYITFAKDKHVCIHCQRAFNSLQNLKGHIKRMHREVTTMYQCPYCVYETKWNILSHIIQKHKDIQCFQNFDEQMFRYLERYTNLKRPKLTHLKPEETHCKVEIKQRRFSCDKCDHKSCTLKNLNIHKIMHLKSEEIQYFHCYHCSYKSKQKCAPKMHIFKHHFKNVEIKQKRKRFSVGKCDHKTSTLQNLNMHKLNRLKPKEIQYFYCYHCFYKCKRKSLLKIHIFRQHFKNVKIEQKRKRYCCDQCDYKAHRYYDLKTNQITHLKLEDIQYFYCNHCSLKMKYKMHLILHISKQFRNEDVPFHCYICGFMTLKRELIIDHVKKHSKVQIKSEINEGS